MRAKGTHIFKTDAKKFITAFSPRNIWNYILLSFLFETKRTESLLSKNGQKLKNKRKPQSKDCKSGGRRELPAWIRQTVSSNPNSEFAKSLPLFYQDTELSL